MAESADVDEFVCGDKDIDEFFSMDCFGYAKQLLGRLGVASEFQSKHIGSEVLDFVKYWFVEPNNKTGCRFVIVDAYNNPATMAFYERNGFKMVFSTDEQEKDYRHLEQSIHLNTRLMYFDLISIIH